MAAQYSPTSSMYQMLMGLANNPSAAQNPNINAEISSAIQGPVMPDVTATGPNGQSWTIPYNVAPPANATNVQLNAPGSPGWLQNAPGGSAATMATPVTNPATQWQPPAQQQANTLAPGATGSPDQSAGGNGLASVGGAGGPATDTGIVGAPPTAQQQQQWWSSLPPAVQQWMQQNGISPGGSPDQPGGSGLGTIGGGGPITAQSLNPRTMGAQGYPGSSRNGSTGIDPTSGLPINFGGLNLGSLSSTALLPALISSLGGLWSYLGSSAKYNQAGQLVNTAEQNAGSQVNSTADQAANNILGTAQNAGAGVMNATGTANNTLAGLYNNSTSALSPYSTAGATGADQLTSGLQPGGALNNTLTPDQILQQNPGYQFTLGEGERGIQNQLAAEGLGDSGAAGKAITDYQQNLAKNAYQQAFQNQQTQEQNLFGRLYNTAGLGTTATGQGITAGEAFGAPQASNDISSSIYGGNAEQTAAENAGGFNLTGSQYQGNANVTGAGAQAGALVDQAQQQQAFIQQLTTSLLSMFQNQGGSSGSGGGLANYLAQLLGGGSGTPGSVSTDPNGNTTTTLPSRYAAA
jgi:hypothetical protein